MTRWSTTPTLRWLADYRFTGDVWGYGEGETFFPGSPLLVVEAGFAEACGAGDARPVDPEPRQRDRRRRQPDDRRRARPALPGDGLAAHPRGGRRGRRPGRRTSPASPAPATSRPDGATALPTIGTAAHAFTLLHDDERAAFAAQVASLGAGTTLLVDTYDVEQGVRTAVEVAGPALGAVRLDSGDLLEQAYAVRAQLDALGARNTKIVVTSDLDEFAIAALAAAPVDVLRGRHIAGHRFGGADRRAGLQAGRPGGSRRRPGRGGQEEPGEDQHRRAQVGPAPALARRRPGRGDRRRAHARRGRRRPCAAACSSSPAARSSAPSRWSPPGSGTPRRWRNFRPLPASSPAGSR